HDEVRPEAARLEAMGRRELAQAVERVGRDEVDRAEVEEGSGGGGGRGRGVAREWAGESSRRRSSVLVVTRWIAQKSKKVPAGARNAAGTSVTRSPSPPPARRGPESGA